MTTFSHAFAACAQSVIEARQHCARCGGSLTLVTEGQVPKRLGDLLVFDRVPFLACNACECIYLETSWKGYGVNRITKEAVR